MSHKTRTQVLGFFLWFGDFFHKFIVENGNWFDSLQSLWPSDPISQHTPEPILSLVIACYLMAPSHYLNQFYMLTINDVLWHSWAIPQWVTKLLLLENSTLRLLPCILGASKFIFFLLVFQWCTSIWCVAADCWLGWGRGETVLISVWPICKFRGTFNIGVMSL